MNSVVGILKKHHKLASLVVFVAIIFTLKMYVGNDFFQPENLRNYLKSHESVGFFIYLALFFLGNVIQIPGVVFVVAAVWAFGKVTAFFYTYAVAVTACSLSYFLIRYVFRLKQDEDLSRFEKFKKYEVMFNENPVKAHSILRVIFQTAPVLNLFLSYKTKSYKPYFIGLIVGIPVPLAFYVFFIEELIKLSS